MDITKLVKFGKYDDYRAKNVVLVFGAEFPTIESIKAVADQPERDILFISVTNDNAHNILRNLDTPWELFIYGDFDNSWFAYPVTVIHD